MKFCHIFTSVSGFDQSAVTSFPFQVTNWDDDDFTLHYATKYVNVILLRKVSLLLPLTLENLPIILYSHHNPKSVCFFVVVLFLHFKMF